MSQFDLSISFSQLVGLLIFFYFFLYYIFTTVSQYLYNEKFRRIGKRISDVESFGVVNLVIVKRILRS